MCFSAEADLAIGVVVTAIGIDAVHHNDRRHLTPLATLPVVFGLHQLTEVFVWLGLDGRLPADVATTATSIYLTVALVFLPVFIPVATSLAGQPARWEIVAFTGTGLVVAATMGLALLDGPATSAIEAHHIHYVVHVWQRDPLIALYAIATCGPLLRSTDQRLVWPGAVNVVAGLALVWIDQTAFVSLWCLWAAVVSAAIALYVRASRTLEERGATSRRLMTD